MTEPKIPQITVLDAGGQYCHLISRKVRDLGVYAEVRPSETPASELRSRRGVIISGGPASVYEAGSPTIDPRLLSTGTPVLGICYGQQLVAHLLNGLVRKGVRGEYGAARLYVDSPDPLLHDLPQGQRIWMSHRDTVEAVPPGFRKLAHTETCSIAAMADEDRHIHCLQFHPEVVHTQNGAEILRRFIFDVCRCERDWDLAGRVQAVEDEIRQIVRDRKVIFFVSGGVDSSVAYTLAVQALGPDRVRGFYVDTGLMREGETEAISRAFPSLEIEHCSDLFLSKLSGVTEPEEKRRIIGETFVEVQEQILEREHFLDGGWILGQGTIYPDTIESGGTTKAEVIKTHHNRVAGIQKLIEAGRIVEPLRQFYKDEVRALGRELALAPELLERHPFPGPGLAIRCLCSVADAPLRHISQGWIVPVHSVGVQGDSRSYRPVLALEHQIDRPDISEVATELTNEISDVNRVIGVVAAHGELERARVNAATLSQARIETLRRADAIVRALSHASDFDRQVWQFPVVLVPVGTAEQRDSVVLRPIDSVDGMTAQAVRIPETLLQQISHELLAIPGVFGVFCDLTNKPPATIEWE